MATKEYDKIASTIVKFLAETQYFDSLKEPRVTLNKYFIVDYLNDDKDKEEPIVYLKTWNKTYSLWSHSTIDISDARNFTLYMRTVCKNLLLGPKWWSIF